MFYLTIPLKKSVINQDFLRSKCKSQDSITSVTIFGLGVTFVEKEFRLFQVLSQQHKQGQKKEVRVSQVHSLVKKT